MSIVGDAYAGPMVDELRRRPYDLSSLMILGTGGAATGEQHKEALLDLLPTLVIMDGYGASETGGMAYGARTKGSRSEGFVPSAGATVISEDRTRFLDPGDEELGWTARRGRVPLGYLHDRERTESTFPIIDGERVALPGDRARLSEDGRIIMYGRDSLVVNTGGEKVFVEEVEEVLRRHPDVADALVVGRPSSRFGHEVVAVVAPAPGASSVPGRVARVRGRGDRPLQGTPGRGGGRAAAPACQRQGRLRLGGGGGARGGVGDGRAGRRVGTSRWTCQCARRDSERTPAPAPAAAPASPICFQASASGWGSDSGSGTSKWSSRIWKAAFVPCWARALMKLNSPSSKRRLVP